MTLLVWVLPSVLHANSKYFFLLLVFTLVNIHDLYVAALHQQTLEILVETVETVDIVDIIVI